MPEPTINYTVNSADNVTTGKGVAGGYFFSFTIPKNQTTGAVDTSAYDTLIASLVTDLSTVPSGAVNLGHVSSDGIKENESKNTTTETDMNGDPVYVTQSDRTEDWTVRLIEKRKDALSEVYGHGNVSGTEGSGSVVAQHNGNDHDQRIYVIDLVFKDASRGRKIMPMGQVTSIAELQINSTNLYGRDMTISASMYTSANQTYNATVIDVYGARPTSS